MNDCERRLRGGHWKMRLVKVHLICVYLILPVSGCRDTLWFQASFLPVDGELDLDKARVGAPVDEGRALLLHRSSQPVADVKECARLCYVKLAQECGSAVFEHRNDPHNGVAYGWCQLLSKQYPCAQHRPLVASVTTSAERPKTMVLLHCFYCNRFAWSKWMKPTPAESETSAMTPLPISKITNETNTEKGEKRNDDSLKPDTNAGTMNLAVGTEMEHSSSVRSTTKIIRVMTFNTWISGNNVHDGIKKIASHILSMDADIVGLQEMDDFAAQRILDTLASLYQQHQRSPIWYHCGRSSNGLNHILSRFLVTQEYDPSQYLKNNGCQLRVHDQPPRYINVWNVHLRYEDYGPYAACNRSSAAPIRDLNDRLFACEYKPTVPDKSRLHQTLRFLHGRVIKDTSEAHEDARPMIFVMGDFNSPSHLDWTTAASTLHCNIAYDWPISKLMADFGFLDSFRVAKPDPTRDQGITWSPIYNTKPWLPTSSLTFEPQDRIDYIYYLAGNRDLAVKQSFVYTGRAGLRPPPYHEDNDWPSDHAAVITDFELTVGL